MSPYIYCFIQPISCKDWQNQRGSIYYHVFVVTFPLAPLTDLR